VVRISWSGRRIRPVYSKPRPIVVLSVSAMSPGLAPRYVEAARRTAASKLADRCM
jgi:hypothetical protein